MPKCSISLFLKQLGTIVTGGGNIMCEKAGINKRIGEEGLAWDEGHLTSLEGRGSGVPSLAQF